MLAATLLALASAVLHAGWNLAAKRSEDPLFALWTQFAVAGVFGAILVAATGGLPAGAWAWAAVSGVVHVPYLLALGTAYRHGDFSLAYPVARGGGALLAAVGGFALLGDDFGVATGIAIVVVVAGMLLLGVGASWTHVAIALVVAATIGTYTLSDSHAARTYERITYVGASQAACGIAALVVGTMTGRLGGLATLRGPVLGRTALAAAMSLLAYGLVLAAVRDAPVGYVAALRESSVLLAALAGWRMLGEQHGRSRAIGAGLIFAGLVALVTTR